MLETRQLEKQAIRECRDIRRPIFERVISGVKGQAIRRR